MVAGKLETIDKIDACCATREDGFENRSCGRLHCNVVECRRREEDKKQGNTMVQRQHHSDRPSLPASRLGSYEVIRFVIESKHAILYYNGERTHSADSSLLAINGFELH
jgi:hypothetical protein